MTAVDYAGRPSTIATNTLFGRVMGLVALTVLCAHPRRLRRSRLGRCRVIRRRLLSFGCLIGLNVANARGNTGLALVLLLAFGLLTGASVATTINCYAATDPMAVRQAFGATALFVGVLGAGGYATRRDLSFLYRIAFVAAARLCWPPGSC